MHRKTVQYEFMAVEDVMLRYMCTLRLAEATRVNQINDGETITTNTH